MIEEDNTKEELTEQNDENIEVISIEEDAEILIDQVEDFTLETTSIRSSLMRRLPLVLGTTVAYFILRTFDKNYIFNPVNSSLFEVIAMFILFYSIFSLIAIVRLKETTYHLKDTYTKFKKVDGILDFLSVVPILMLVVTVLNVFFISFSPISGTSMEPNYHDDEAVVFAHFTVTYKRFDVVIVYVEQQSEPYLIKRIIGLPGETVLIDDNEIYIDGVLLEQSFIDQDEIKTYCVTGHNINYCSFMVPDNSYFVLGDNRDGNAIDTPSGYSIDSRTFGSVPIEDIYGKVILQFKDYNLLNQE
jgi:signal peptidase I